ncbi:MAG: type II toxin-antitoxin system RelE/ParE family toxin [Proteobacteria bacterium]|nr:type II toxin-antitoxin system RelE/ParE family toxin [Pseudomonadota bacterium]
MIKSFGNKTAQDLAFGKASTRHARLLPQQHHQRAIDLLEFMEGSVDVSDFKLPSSNRLHKLGNELAGYWSITIRGGWRIIFKFDDGYYWDVKILDYH